MELRKRPRIGVMGPAVCTPRVAELARDVGRLIAEKGGILVCGGLGGVMEAAAAGAKSAGGVTIGILPGASASEANSSIDIPIVTAMGSARNAINVLSSQAVIAIHGASGTLSEIALALKCGTPVVGLQTWTLIPPPEGAPAEITTARNAEEAVSAALELIRRRSPV